jgi:hypothetical protein
MNSPIYTDSETARRSNGTFGPGNVANPGGRPRGSQSGRAKALALLDQIIGEEENLQRLEQALRENFLADPFKFFKTIIMPLLPSETINKIDLGPRVISWTSLTEARHRKESDQNQPGAN